MPSSSLNFGIDTVKDPLSVRFAFKPSSDKKQISVNFPLPIDTSTNLVQWDAFLDEATYMQKMFPLLQNYCFHRGAKGQPTYTTLTVPCEFGSFPSTACLFHETCRLTVNKIEAMGGVFNFIYDCAFRIYFRNESASAAGVKRKRGEAASAFKLELVLFPTLSDTIDYKDCLKISYLPITTTNVGFYLTLHKNLLPGIHTLPFNGLLYTDEPLMDTDGLLASSNTSVVVLNVFKNTMTLQVNQAINISEDNGYFLLGRIDQKFIDIITDEEEKWKVVKVHFTTGNPAHFDRYQKFIPEILKACGVNIFTLKGFVADYNNEVFGLVSSNLSLGVIDVFKNIGPEVTITTEVIDLAFFYSQNKGIEFTDISITAPTAVLNMIEERIEGEYHFSYLQFKQLVEQISLNFSVMKFDVEKMVESQIYIKNIVLRGLSKENLDSLFRQAKLNF